MNGEPSVLGSIQIIRFPHQRSEKQTFVCWWFDELDLNASANQVASTPVGFYTQTNDFAFHKVGSAGSRSPDWGLTCPHLMEAVNLLELTSRIVYTGDPWSHDPKPLGSLSMFPENSVKIRSGLLLLLLLLKQTSNEASLAEGIALILERWDAKLPTVMWYQGGHLTLIVIVKSGKKKREREKSVM